MSGLPNTNFAGAAASLAPDTTTLIAGCSAVSGVREDKQRIFGFAFPRFAWGLACVSPLARNTNHHRERLAAVFIAAAACALALSPVARADDDCTPAPWTTPGCYKHADEGFYNSPPPQAAPGQIVRQEPSQLVLEPSGVIPGWRADGTRIMYWSTTGGLR